MARTTPILVKGILGGDYDEGLSPSLSPYIDTASMVIDQVVVCAVAKGVALTDLQLEMIERWLSAHCYTCMDPSYLEKQTQSARGRFFGTSGLGLDGSRYGQMAKRLDFSGCLASIDKPSRPRMDWLGLVLSEQTDYEDRD